MLGVFLVIVVIDLAVIVVHLEKAVLRIGQAAVVRKTVPGVLLVIVVVDLAVIVIVEGRVADLAIVRHVMRAAHAIARLEETLPVVHVDEVLLVVVIAGLVMVVVAVGRVPTVTMVGHAVVTTKTVLGVLLVIAVVVVRLGRAVLEVLLVVAVVDLEVVVAVVGRAMVIAVLQRVVVSANVIIRILSTHVRVVALAVVYSNKAALEVTLFIIGPPERAAVIIAVALRHDPQAPLQSFLVAPAGGRLWRSRRVANRVSSLWISSITSMSGSCAIVAFASEPAEDIAATLVLVVPLRGVEGVPRCASDLGRASDNRSHVELSSGEYGMLALSSDTWRRPQSWSWRGSAGAQLANIRSSSEALSLASVSLIAQRW